MDDEERRRIVDELKAAGLAQFWCLTKSKLMRHWRAHPDDRVKAAHMEGRIQAILAIAEMQHPDARENMSVLLEQASSGMKPAEAYHYLAGRFATGSWNVILSAGA